MKVSKIKEEVEHSKDVKVKLEKNPSSVVYEVKVSSKINIKSKQEDPSQIFPTSVTKEEIESVIYAVKPDEYPLSSVVYEVEVTSKVGIKSEEDKIAQIPSTSVTNEEIQSAVDINVMTGKYPSSDELESEPESKSNSNEESEIDSEGDSSQKRQHQILRSQARSTNRKSNKNVSKSKREPVIVSARKLLQCTLCPRSFPRVGLLITHVRNKHATIKCPSSKSTIDDEASLQCPLCQKSLSSVKSLRRHFLYFHIKNKPFQCSVCLESKNEIKKFSTESNLNLHMKRAHGPTRYTFQCEICSKKFSSLCNYKCHKDTHTEMKYKCEYCSKAYRKHEVMLRHIIAVHKEYTDRHETFKCVECEQLFCSKKDLEGHVLQTHVKDTVQCKLCFKKFRIEGELSRHLEVSHKENRTWLVCDVCLKVFKNNKDLVQHLEVQHQRLFKCRKCFKSFVSKEEYESHSTEYLNEEGRNAKKAQLQCKICLVFLNTECSFITHKDTHLIPGEIGSRNVLQLQPAVIPGRLQHCDFCPKTFQQKSLLLEHTVECHSNEKKWECKSCEKSFQLKYQLNKHEMLHSANKLFECKECEKCYTSLEYLKLHENIHKKRQEYQCSQCEKCYETKPGLKYHVFNHHRSEKPFKCDICKKTFAFKFYLVRHSVVHSDERPFRCSECSKSYNYANQLRLHQQKNHSENPTNKYGKSLYYPVRLGPHLKYFENLVYICCVEDCDFETKDEKEVALHYAKHNLPKVVLPRLLHGPSSQVFLSKSTQSNQHAIEARYKCLKCLKTFSWSSSLRYHTMTSHDGKKTKRRKRRYSLSSDEDSM